LRDKNIYVFVYAFHISWSALCSGILARYFGDTIPKLPVGIKALGSKTGSKEITIGGLETSHLRHKLYLVANANSPMTMDGCESLVLRGMSFEWTETGGGMLINNIKSRHLRPHPP
jgi:hypothetical protein